MALLVRLDRLDQWDPQVHQEPGSRHRALLELLDFLAKMALQDTPEPPEKTDSMAYLDLRVSLDCKEPLVLPDSKENPALEDLTELQEPLEPLEKSDSQDHQD